MKDGKKKTSKANTTIESTKRTFEDEDKEVDNEFEALAETKRVYSKVPLNSDHVLAYLPAPEKELITETLFNATFAKNILERYATSKAIPQWSKKDKDWERNEDGSIRYFSLKEIDLEGYNECLKNASEIFNLFMLKINSIALVNRNRSDNFMLDKGWYKNREDENKVINYTEDDRNILEKAKDKLLGDNEYEVVD